MKKAAAIDIGTNTFKWLAAKATQNGFEHLHAGSYKVNLGEGLSEGVLTTESMERGIAALLFAREQLENQGVDINKSRVIATSAVRNASNHAEWIAKVLQQTGFHVEVIDGNEEARLIFQGIKASGSLGQEPVLIMDIGGGSVEFIIGNNDEIFWKQSFEIGGYRLMQKFQTSDPISPEAILDILDFLDQKLEPLVQAISQCKPVYLVGSSGSFDTLGWMHHLKLNLPERDYPIKKYAVPLQSFHHFYGQFITFNRQQRMQMPGMIELRVELIVVGSILIKWVLQHLGPYPIVVSGYSLKEGVIWEMLKSR